MNPNHQVPPRLSSYVVKRGYVLVKEEGLRAFLWSKRWLLLREQTLTFHRNEVISLILSVYNVYNVEYIPSVSSSIFKGNRIHFKNRIKTILYRNCNKRKEFLYFIQKRPRIVFMDG